MNWCWISSFCCVGSNELSWNFLETVNLTILTPVVLHSISVTNDITKIAKDLWKRIIHDLVDPNREKQMYRELFALLHFTIFGDLISVFHVFVARILDVPVFDPEMKPCQSVTLHQLMSFIKEEDLDLGDFLQTLSGELWVSSRLRSGNTDIIIKTMLTFRTTLPPAECLRVVSLLLITENPEVRSAAGEWSQHPQLDSASSATPLLNSTSSIHIHH